MCHGGLLWWLCLLSWYSGGNGVFSAVIRQGMVVVIMVAVAV